MTTKNFHPIVANQATVIIETEVGTGHPVRLICRPGDAVPTFERLHRDSLGGESWRPEADHHTSLRMLLAALRDGGSWTVTAPNIARIILCPPFSVADGFSTAES